MKSKLWKEIIVAVLLISTIVSFSPIAYGQTTSIQQSIDSIKMEIKKAALAYIEPALEGELVSSSSLDPVLNSVKKNYEVTKKLILASNLSEKEKQAKLKELDALYEEKITKGLIPYIDAYNYATKYLEPILKEIKEAEAKKDFAAIEKAYHKLSVQLKSRSAILYRFTGKAARDLLLEKYKKPSDEKRDELIIPVTIYMKIAEAQQLLLEGKKEEAQKILEGIPALIAELSSTNAFHQVVKKELEKLQANIFPTPETPVTPPVTPPSGGSGGNGGSSETAAQRALRIAKADANATLTKYKEEVDYSKENWSEIKSLIEMGKKNINSSRTVDEVQLKLTDAQIELDQVLTIAQESTAVYVKDETELRNAVSDKDTSIIVLLNNIEINQPIEIEHSIELFGNGKTISTHSYSALDFIGTTNSKIHDLVVDAANTDVDEAIYIEDSSNIQLMNITLKNVGSGLSISNSTVTAHNIKTVGNRFYGIDLWSGTITITGTASHMDNAGAPAIVKADQAIVNSNLYEEIEEIEESDGTEYWVLKGTKPVFVSQLIPLIGDQHGVELLRSIYNGLTPAEQSQVTNIEQLDEIEQKLVENMAGSISPTYQPWVAPSGTISLPFVNGGYSISVHSSSDENIYDKDGKILASGSSTVVYTVTHNMSGKTANTKPVVVNVTINQAPIVPIAMITGMVKVGETLTGNYTYLDHEGDMQGTSTFKWYRADDVLGATKAEISGATSNTYTLIPDDLGKYIFFEVTPVANTGETLGVPTLSLPMATAVVNNLLLEEKVVEEDSSIQDEEPTIAPTS